MIEKADQNDLEPFRNDDNRLLEQVEAIVEQRRAAGLEGLVGDLDCVIVNTEPDHHQGATEELLRYTGYECADVFLDALSATAVLRVEDSADMLVRSRANGANPFADVNRAPRTEGLPNTRLETYVFETTDLESYVAIQKSRNIAFLTDKPIRTDNFLYIQTPPSPLTGNATGFIEWHGERNNYRTPGSRPLDCPIPKPDAPHLRNIGTLDHAATRVRAEHRDPAVLEFMNLTSYVFAFAIHVPTLNSITNVARLPDAKFALVFTSGISPFVSHESSGPTERFIENYGTRTHHLAYVTQDIDDTFAHLKQDGLGFLSELVGSPEEGLKQAFCDPSPHTLLVNEYIHRFGGFDGFFTEHNVTRLTEATRKQVA